MSDRLVPMAHDDLEARLADLATVIAFPSTPDLATAVGARLRLSLPPSRPLARLIPIRRSVRSVRRSLLLAAALALLVVGAAFAVRFGLELLSIQFGPLPSVAPAPSAPAPGASATPRPPGTGLGLGQPLSLDEARRFAAFDLLVPAGLAAPDVVYLGGSTLRGQVAFVYAASDRLPASDLLGGAGLLITQNRGQPDDGLAQKLVSTGQARVEQVVVNGAPGVWISGEPHFYWYLAPDGTMIEESRRLVGDTLAWERDGILYRIEGSIGRDEALEIARSMR
jgi:hypothetical protein